MNVVNLIKKKKYGGELNYQEIEYLISGYTNGEIPDYQFSAFLMAVNFTGMTESETYYLTEIMIQSGKVVDLSHINAPKIDKHSTGGVGDKISLLLAPLVAAFGIAVPMISGRGLGYTGGTLDKLESIPGFKVNYSTEQFVNFIESSGLCMIGQTDELAPADRKIYALRDVTGTVDCRPLIVASILSKKISEGTDAIVFDVKLGSGANLPDTEASKDLAKQLITVAGKMGKKSIAVLSDMNCPLGYKIGNWLEVEECLEIMGGKKVDDVVEVNNVLAGAMFKLAGKVNSIEEGKKISEDAIVSDEMKAKFKTMVRQQGGDMSYVNDWKNLKRSEKFYEIKADSPGYLSRMDAQKFGLASVELGAGRKKVTDKIDHLAGIELLKKPGDMVQPDDIICRLFAQSQESIEQAVKFLDDAIQITPEKPLERKLIIDIFE